MFGTVFTKGKVEIGVPLDPVEFNQRKTSMLKMNNLKKLLILVIICALTMTVLLIVKQITAKDSTEQVNSSPVQSSAIGHNLTTNQMVGHIIEEPIAQTSTQTVMIESTTPSPTTSTTTTTTTTVSTTEGTTTTTTIVPKVIDHLTASIVINNATVPNRDGYVSLTDTYVKAFVDDHYIGQTPVQKETLNPMWNYQIGYKMTLRPDSVLRFKLYDNDKYTSHEFIGEFEVKTSDLIEEDSNGQTIQKQHGSGHLWFTINWEVVYRNS